jgi:hypothetical protein
MALMIASGIGSIVANELGKIALDNMPLIKQVASDTAIKVAKKTVDYTLAENPNLATFLGHFGFTGFNTGYSRTTLMKRGKHRKISYHNN